MKHRLVPLALAVACALCAGDARADARAEVLAAFEKAQAHKSYRVVSTTELEGKPVVTTIDVQLPASFHMKNPDTEMIVLPGATWMNQGGQWMRLPMDMSGMVKNMTLQAMREGADLVKSVEETGQETVEGCASSLYKYRTEGRVMGIDATADVQLAVCDSTGLPVRAISEDAKGRGRTVITYDYEAAVDIRPPN